MIRKTGIVAVYAQLRKLSFGGEEVLCCREFPWVLFMKIAKGCTPASMLQSETKNPGNMGMCS
jgi:hypothetical protein